MNRFLMFLAGLICCIPCAYGSSADNDTLIAGSQRDDFVTVSLLLASPGNKIYSIFGHCGLRMQCPSQHLDYVYTFEMESGAAGYAKFFAGQAKAGFAAVPTAEYLNTYAQEERGITAYTLNLTPHEKQELWRALDNDMAQGPHRKYNLIKNQCLSMNLLLVEEIMENEYIDFTRLPQIMLSYKNGQGVRYLSRKSPWATFVFLTLMGTEADAHWEEEYRMCPETMPYILRYARIVSVDRTKSRPLLKSAPQTLCPARLVITPSPLSPNVVFGAFFVFALLLTVAQYRGRCHQLAKAFDRTLFVLQTVAGFSLLYITLVTGLFGMHWNWYLIPFNPLPFLLWLCLRRKKGYHQLFKSYTVIIIVAVPLLYLVTSQADLAHTFILLTLAARTFCHGWQLGEQDNNDSFGDKCKKRNLITLSHE